MGWRRRGGTGSLASAGAVLASCALLMPLPSSQPAGAASAAEAAQGAQTARAPSAHRENGECLVSGAPSIVAGIEELVVAPQPTGLNILWLPGSGSTACAIATTHAGASTAAALGRAIDHAPDVPNGSAFSCPEDDFTRALISFTYTHHRPAPRLFVNLRGCRFISQSGKEDRSTTPAVRDKLAALAPCGWRTYFADSAGACPR